MMKQLLFVFLICLTSCNYFDAKKVSSDEIFIEEMQAIKWDEVDEYPTFETCDLEASNEEKKNCFEQDLMSRLHNHLSNQHIIVSEDINDTLLLKISIGKDGEFSIKSLDMNARIQALIPSLDSVLRHSFDSIPKIYPAIKRGQQVATEFSLPVIINIQ